MVKGMQISGMHRGEVSGMHGTHLMTFPSASELPAGPFIVHTCHSTHCTLVILYRVHCTMCTVFKEHGGHFTQGAM